VKPLRKGILYDETYICSLCLETNILKETFEDTKGVIRIRKSENDGQYNDQKKKDKGTDKDLQNMT